MNTIIGRWETYDAIDGKLYFVFGNDGSMESNLWSATEITRGKFTYKDGKITFYPNAQTSSTVGADVSGNTLIFTYPDGTRFKYNRA